MEKVKISICKNRVCLDYKVVGNHVGKIALVLTFTIIIFYISEK